MKDLIDVVLKAMEASQIRDPESWIRSMPSYKEFNKMLGGKMSDIDAVYDHHGHGIAFEFKHCENGYYAPLSDGQVYAQQSLLTKGFVIVNIWHTGPACENDIKRIQIFMPDYLQKDRFKKRELNGGLEVMTKLLTKWKAKVDTMPLPVLDQGKSVWYRMNPSAWKWGAEVPENKITQMSKRYIS